MGECDAKAGTKQLESAILIINRILFLKSKECNCIGNTHHIYP
jgi:hypothetical protein